jgi:hypothetical protein
MNRYRAKRTNRQWKKVVRYDCRKNLADTRLRIKGRFVRRDSEEAKAYFANLKLDLVRFWTGGKHGGGGVVVGGVADVFFFVGYFVRFRIKKYRPRSFQN